MKLKKIFEERCILFRFDQVQWSGGDLFHQMNLFLKREELRLSRLDEKTELVFVGIHRSSLVGRVERSSIEIVDSIVRRRHVADRYQTHSIAIALVVRSTIGGEDHVHHWMEKKRTERDKQHRRYNSRIRLLSCSSGRWIEWQREIRSSLSCRRDSFNVRI